MSPALFGRQPGKKVLIVYTEILEYRIPFFNVLGQYYMLTVVHAGCRMTHTDSHFREIVLPRLRLGRFSYQIGLRKLIRSGEYDFVVYFMDVSWISTVVAFLRNYNSVPRLIWGLWRTGHRLADFVRIWLAKQADFNIFYSRAAAMDFIDCGVHAERVSIALNSFHVENPARNDSSYRDSILVVGTFNARKQNDVTLAAFIAVADRLQVPARLVFVGNGTELPRLQSLAHSSRMRDRIEFHPPTFNEDELRSYYDRARCSVSFGQAGLSVLQSFAFGVPFVTRKDAISGGEIENIEHGVNGFLCEPESTSLEDVLLNLLDDSDLSDWMGRNAIAYYKQSANVENMIAGFLRAIEHPSQRTQGS